MGKQCLQIFSAIFNLSLFLLAGKQDRLKVLINFDFCRAWTNQSLAYVSLSEKAKRCLQHFSAIFYQIFFILMGKQERHKMLS